MKQGTRKFGLKKRREGAVIVVVAVMLVVIVGMAAFAIDNGMLLSSRADAQRAADAAALAAATAFLDAPWAGRQALAEDRGTDWATRNSMLRNPIQPDEVTIELVSNSPNGLRVRATVRRPEVQTFFAGIWGIKTLPVAAAAEAEVRRTGKVDCIRPLGLPSDYLDVFGPYEEITAYRAKNDTLVVVTLDPKEPPGVGGVWKQFSAECDDTHVALDDGLLWEKPGSGGSPPANNTGEGWAQVRNGVNDLIALDPTLAWDGSQFTRGGVPTDDWASSPRVGNIILYDRDDYISGTSQLRVVDFARVFFSRTTPTNGANVNNFEVKVVLLPAQGLLDDCDDDDVACASNAYTIGLVK